MFIQSNLDEIQEKTKSSGPPCYPLDIFSFKVEMKLTEVENVEQAVLAHARFRRSIFRDFELALEYRSTE